MRKKFKAHLLDNYDGLNVLAKADGIYVDQHNVWPDAK